MKRKPSITMRFVAMAALLSCWSRSEPAQAQTTGKPPAIELGSRRELFVDRASIETLDHVRLHLHEPRDEGAVLTFDRPCKYFKNTPPPNLHHKTCLLWASVKLDGLPSVAEQQATSKELLALQRSDGGWSLESLGEDWVGQTGEKSNPDAPSDGYGTGPVVYLLRRAGVPLNDASIQRGKSWLAGNQRASGRWFTRSLNGVKQHDISDAATAFAVLALDACKRSGPTLPDSPESRKYEFEKALKIEKK